MNEMTLQSTYWPDGSVRNVRVLNFGEIERFSVELLDSANERFLTRTGDVITIKAENVVLKYRVTDTSEATRTVTAELISSTLPLSTDLPKVDD